MPDSAIAVDALSPHAVGRFRALPSHLRSPIPKANCQFNNGVESLKATTVFSGTAVAVKEYQKVALWTQLSMSLASLPEEQVAEQ